MRCFFVVGLCWAVSLMWAGCDKSGNEQSRFVDDEGGDTGQIDAGQADTGQADAGQADAGQPDASTGEPPSPCGNTLGELCWTVEPSFSSDDLVGAYELALESDGTFYLLTNTVREVNGAPAWDTVEHRVEKYDASGVREWVRALDDGLKGTAIAVAPSGVVIAGANADDTLLVVRALDAAGTPLGDRTFEGISVGEVRSVAVDATGNILVVAVHDTLDERYNALLVKFNAGDGVAWSKSVDGPVSGSDVSHDLAVDAGGTVYWLLYEDNWPTSSPSVLRRYSPNGTLDWETVVANTPWVLGLALDGLGNPVVAGADWSQERASSFLFARKYDPNMEVVWTYEGADSTEATSVAVDVDGSVRIAGYTRSGQLVVTKLNAQGEEMWSRTVSAPQNSVSSFVDVACDRAGNTVVIGNRELHYFSLDNTGLGESVIVQKYSP